MAYGFGGAVADCGFSWLRGPRVYLISHPYAREGADGQAVVCPLLRGSLATRGVAPKQHRGLRRAFSPGFRAGSLYPLARGGRTSWRGVVLVYWFRRCINLISHPYAREGADGQA